MVLARRSMVLSSGACGQRADSTRRQPDTSILLALADLT
jgi:hypothetical protein